MPSYVCRAQPPAARKRSVALGKAADLAGRNLWRRDEGGAGVVKNGQTQRVPGGFVCRRLPVEHFADVVRCRCDHGFDHEACFRCSHGIGVACIGGMAMQTPALKILVNLGLRWCSSMVLVDGDETARLGQARCAKDCVCALEGGPHHGMLEGQHMFFFGLTVVLVFGHKSPPFSTLVVLTL